MQTFSFYSRSPKRQQPALMEADQYLWSNRLRRAVENTQA